MSASTTSPFVTSSAGRRVRQRDLVERRRRSGTVGVHGYYGTYLTATSTFFGAEGTAAQYGIFSSNSQGGTWTNTYASNFNDSGMYVGACLQVCDHRSTMPGWSTARSATRAPNSGGALVIEELAVRQQQRRSRHQHPDRRRPAARRTARARVTAPARSRTRIRAGCSSTTSCTTTTTPTCPLRAARPPVPWAPG